MQGVIFLGIEGLRYSVVGETSRFGFHVGLHMNRQEPPVKPLGKRYWLDCEVNQLPTALFAAPVKFTGAVK